MTLLPATPSKNISTTSLPEWRLWQIQHGKEAAQWCHAMHLIFMLPSLLSPQKKLLLKADFSNNTVHSRLLNAYIQNQINLQRIWIPQYMLSSLCVNLSFLSHSNCIKELEWATREQGDPMLRNRNLLPWFGKEEAAHSILCGAMQCWPDSRCILVSSSLSLLPAWWWSAQQAHP